MPAIATTSIIWCGLADSRLNWHASEIGSQKCLMMRDHESTHVAHTVCDRSGPRRVLKVDTAVSAGWISRLQQNRTAGAARARMWRLMTRSHCCVCMGPCLVSKNVDTFCTKSVSKKRYHATRKRPRVGVNLRDPQRCVCNTLHMQGHILVLRT